MNNKEKRMLEILKELRDDYNIVGVKAELEAEGTRKNEMIRLLEIVCRANLGLYIKIGGCEALTDICDCKIFGAEGIIAPMIETPYAMKKYIQMIDKVYTKEEQKDIKFAFNCETITSFYNVEEIIETGKDKISNISIGRVDLSGSLGIGRDNINGEEMYEKVKILLEKTKEKKLRTCMGGGISIDATSFIKRLGSLLDIFETRKIIFNNSSNINFQDALILSTEFELLYLKNKEDYYVRISEEDASRIKMMEERLNRLKEIYNG